MLALFLTAALAAPPESTLTWDLSVGGAPVGTRTVTVRVLPGANGTRRIIEAFTEINGRVGPIDLSFRQRLTGNAEGGSPASFHSVIDDNGSASEVQGRWTPGGWIVSTNLGGRARSADYPISRIDLSTVDLMDPESRVGFGSQRETVRMLSAITGEVQTGPVASLGSSEVLVNGTPVPVEGFSWTSPEGKANFYFSTEGYLVKYETHVMGIALNGILRKAPPGGIDDFPVAVGRPSVEVLPL